MPSPFMAKLKGLGRGLDALLSATVDEEPAAREPATLAVDRIVPGRYQPRTRMDDGSLSELADSIRAQGIVQPILVRPVGGGRYEIIAGERRWRAAQMAGLAEVPVSVRNVPDQSALVLALIENIQRENLNPLEEAQALQRLVNDFGLTHEQASNAVGRSRSAVTNLIRLTQLAKPVQDYVFAGDLDMGHARALLPLPERAQVELAARIAQNRLSVREAERLVNGYGRPSAHGRPRPAPDRDLLRLQEELSDLIGAAVTIEPRGKGAGRVTIAYRSLDQLDGILARFRRS
jgi:ParB family chromosome partitioning protein